MKKSAFTLIELLIAISIIAIALMSIFRMMSVAQTYTDRTRQETLAINFAREWVEWVINIRNTNRLRRSWKRDASWLCRDSNLSSTTNCWERISGWISYLLSYSGEIERYPYLIMAGNNAGSQKLTFNDSLSDEQFLIYSWAEGNFYRAIRGKWLYQKDTNIIWWWVISCVNWASNYSKRDDNWTSQTSSFSCSDSTPKEFQFCSKVLYRKQTQGEVELCDIITNYKE